MNMEEYLKEYESDIEYKYGERVTYHGSISMYHGDEFIVVDMSGNGVPGSLALSYPDPDLDPNAPTVDQIAAWNVRPSSVTKVEQ